LFPEYRLFLALADGNSIQTRFQASKRLLTGGTRLENGPWSARSCCWIS
jgi:hypothetical protein